MSRIGGPDSLHFKWDNQQKVYASKFHYLFQQEKFVDVTLSADGQFLKAHRLILCASSQYFEDFFVLCPQLNTLPLKVTLGNISFDDLKLLIEYMYKGEINVTREQLPSFLEAAAALKINALIEQAQGLSIAEPKGHFMDPATPSSSSMRLGLESSTQSNSLTKDAIINTIMKDAENVMDEFDDLIADPLLPLDSHHHEEQVDTLNCSQDSQLSKSSDDDKKLLHFTNRNNPEDNATWTETDDQCIARRMKSVKAAREGLDELQRQKSQRRRLRNVAVHSSRAPLPHLSGDGGEGGENSSSTNLSDDYEPLKEAATSSTAAVAPKRKAKEKRSGSQLAKKVRSHSGSQANTSDDRPFSCSKCGRSYKRKHHLSRHSQYECGVEPGYSCSLCDFRAKRRDNLQDHLVRYHEVDPSQLKVYKAEPKFIRSSNPHKCTKCSRTFKLEKNLERHVKDECRS